MSELEFVIISPDRKIPDIKYLKKIKDAIGVNRNDTFKRRRTNFKTLQRRPI